MGLLHAEELRSLRALSAPERFAGRAGLTVSVTGRRGGHLLFGNRWEDAALSNRLAESLSRLLVKSDPGSVAFINGRRAGKNRESALFYFHKLDRVAGLQSKLFPNVKGKSNSAVEGNHR